MSKLEYMTEEDFNNHQQVGYVQRIDEVAFYQAHKKETLEELSVFKERPEEATKYRLLSSGGEPIVESTYSEPDESWVFVQFYKPLKN